MGMLPAKLTFVFIVALLLSSAASVWTAWRYRAAMRRLMSAAGPASPHAVAAAVAVAAADTTALPPAEPVSLRDNQRAALRLALVLIGASFLIAVSAASLWYLIVFPGEPFPVRRVAVVALVDLWPAIPAIGLIWRWSTGRVLLVLAAWALLCFAVALWRSIEPQPLQLMLYLASEVGVPMVLVALLCLGNAARAVAPWLLPPFAVLAGASVLGTELLGVLVTQRSPVLLWLVSWLDAHLAMALFALLPWLLAWWPLRRLGRALGRAYARKWLSELLVLFTAVWTVALLTKALTAAGAEGPIAIALLLPLLWIPLVVAIDSRWRRASGRAPTLLVLRVFQRLPWKERLVQDLFDHVIERWRLSGNTVLIAGTDLADRTLDADDIFTFLDGGLAARFIRTSADVAPRLAAFDMARDADGRFRVNECYCHDTTWQDALHALVQRSDVVLMDLRSFGAHNAGCRYELGALAQAKQALRVVVLTDGQTDRAAAAEAVAAAPPRRFTWLDTARIDARKRAEVLARLFDAAPAP
jgi:hypothetical protein